jgi:6-phosphogluconolactonase
MLQMPETSMDVRIFEDLDALSNAAAALFVESAAMAVTTRANFLVALSGGGTPQRTYQLLAASPYLEQLDWARTLVFWGDERCVPPEDLENSYRQAHDVLLGHVPIPSANIHRVRSELGPSDAALDYALVLKHFASPPFAWPRFDLVLLGMGNDGHTASLFPGSPVASATPTLAVTAHYEDRPADRVSLSPDVFNSARRVIFLVSGASKARSLAMVLNGDRDPQALPAQRIHPTDGELIWLVDRAAASQL